MVELDCSVEWTMHIIQVEIAPYDNQVAELRVISAKPSDDFSFDVRPSDITDQLEKYSLTNSATIAEDRQAAGRRLYQWLDGSNGRLTNLLDSQGAKGCILAIQSSGPVADLPWEILHDGRQFLVERVPPIVPVRWVRRSVTEVRLSEEDAARDSELRILFMACAPEGVDPVLDFEGEEATILQETRRSAISLVVEESGSVEEMVSLLGEYEEGYFDVLHISGHAEESHDDGARLITEDEVGAPYRLSAADLAKRLQFRMPKLLFLSCCSTAAIARAPNLRPMAEVLVRSGCPAVLGWGGAVLDQSAVVAAGRLYRHLAEGLTLFQSVASVFRELIDQGARDWHLLRLYVSDPVPRLFVDRGRKRRKRRNAEVKFIDRGHRLRVTRREDFVGRRKQLQNSLKKLKYDPECLGLVIHGMGGLGKSTFASRLCDRLPGEPMVLWRTFDERRLSKELEEHLPDAESRRALSESTDGLRFRLRAALDAVEHPIIFVIDDFEWNLDVDMEGCRLSYSISEVLSALAWAVDASTAQHLLIFTCRYRFEAEFFKDRLFYQPLDGFTGADLEKKLRKLNNFDVNVIGQADYDRALALADGNPRLLEYLDTEILSRADRSAALRQVAEDSSTWRDRVIWDELHSTVDSKMAATLAVVDIFTIPVPRSAVLAAGAGIPDFAVDFERCVELGLVEASSGHGPDRYRVPNFLSTIIPAIAFPEEITTRAAAAEQAAVALFGEWGRTENECWPEWWQTMALLTMAELGLAELRSWFSKVISVQFNGEADRAFEMPLYGALQSPDETDKFSTLRNFLDRRDWRSADEETAWLFVLENLRCGRTSFGPGMWELPEEFIRTVDQLWTGASGGRFGFSVQRTIYADLVGIEHIRSAHAWPRLCQAVGWADDRRYLEYEGLQFDLSAPKGHLPLLATVRGTFSQGAAEATILLGDVGVIPCFFGYGWRIGGQESAGFGLFGRLSTGNL